jgi:RNA polymerase sigma factor (sigma-70 family)
MKSEEQFIWRRFKATKNIATRNELISKYTNFVKIIACQVYRTLPRTIDFSDLESYGYIGLMDAIEKFDLDRNIKFETYARFRIKGAIIDGLRELDWFPRSIRDSVKKSNAESQIEIPGQGSSGEEFEADKITDCSYKSKDVDCNYLVTSFMDIDSLSGDILHDEEPVNYAQYDAFVNPEDFVENIENVSYISKILRKKLSIIIILKGKHSEKSERLSA